MLSIISVSDTEKWNGIVRSFDNWDIYYLNEYAVSFQIHGDGIPYLIYYEDQDARFCYVVMKSDLADDSKFSARIEHGEYFDYSTPYGYGGPLTDRRIPEESQRRFMTEMADYARNEKIVSQFVRFHPLLGNHEGLSGIFETRYMHDTIYIDTTDANLIMQNMDSKNRNMVRKAIKCGVSIERKPITEYEAFVSMYNETMLKDEASEYYTFGNEYFRSLKLLEDHACIFYAMREGKPVAGSIMYYNNRNIHYHLSGSRTEARMYAPSNLLLYETACWANEQGIKRFHLGGGIVQDDNLFGFKKQFNKNGRLPFVIGRTVFDKDAYNTLKQIRADTDSGFNPDNGRMIQYRA